MLKKIIITNLLLFFVFFTAVTFAANEDESGNTDGTLSIFKPSVVLPDPHNWKAYIDTRNYPRENGFKIFYIGLSGGLDINSFNVRQREQISAIDKRSNSVGGYGTVTLGFGARFKEDFYLGAAADGSLNWNSKKINKYGNLEIKIPHTFGVYLVPGIFVENNTMIYMELGGVISKLEVSVDNPDISNINSFSKNIWGGRAGLGIRYFINRYFSINGEYVFTYYQDIHDEYNNYKTKYSQFTNQFNIGLALHF